MLASSVARGIWISATHIFFEVMMMVLSGLSCASYPLPLLREVFSQSSKKMGCEMMCLLPNSFLLEGNLKHQASRIVVLFFQTHVFLCLRIA